MNGMKLASIGLLILNLWNLFIMSAGVLNEINYAIITNFTIRSLPEINAGTLADAATLKLPKRIPYHIAMDLLLTGRWMDIMAWLLICLMHYQSWKLS